MRITALSASFLAMVLSLATYAHADDVDELKQENQRLAQELKVAQARIKQLEKSLKKRANDEKSEAKEQASDPFNIGSTFKGSRFYQQKGANPLNAQPWTLEIKTRDKAQFSGEIRFQSVDKRSQRLPVSGTAPPSGKGAVKFSITNGGVFKQDFNGSIKGGKRIELRFEGTGNTGGRVFGTGNLERQ